MESKIEKILHELLNIRRNVMRNRCIYSTKDYVCVISYELYSYLLSHINIYDISLSVDSEGVLEICGQETVLVDMPADEVYFTKKQKISKIVEKEIISFEVEAYEKEDIEKLIENIVDYDSDKIKMRNLERKVICKE